MWVTQYEQEANRWRRKAMRARDEGADFRAAAQQAEGHEPAEGGVEGATSATSESEVRQRGARPRKVHRQKRVSCPFRGFRDSATENSRTLYYRSRFS